MAKPKPVPLPDGCYADASLPFSAQDVVNFWAEYAEGQGTRSSMKLVQLPGLREYLDIGVAPHRGIRNVEGNLFVVAGTHAFWVRSATDVQTLGEIPGRGLVWISHNQTGSGAAFQVMFSDGPNGWIWDIPAQTWTQVSDSAFHGGRSLIYLNSRFLGIEQQRRYFANSDEGDGLAWDSTETYQSEGSPDRLVALIDYGGEVLVFNERTREHFTPSSSPDDIANHIYYTRIGPTVERGGASPHGVSRLDGRVFFVGDDGAGYFVNGYGQERITTPAIETAWAQCDLSKCFCFTYEANGHAVWYVTFPDGHTWGYDCLSSARAGKPVWHRRESIGKDRWRLNTLTKWNGDWYGGAYNSGVLYRVDWSYFGLEGCDEIDRYFIPGVLHDDGSRVSVNALRLQLDTGHETSSCTGADWTPRELSLGLWLKADEAADRLAIDDDLIVQLWADDSGLGRDMSLAAASPPPGFGPTIDTYNGKRVVNGTVLSSFGMVGTDAGLLAMFNGMDSFWLMMVCRPDENDLYSGRAISWESPYVGGAFRVHPSDGGEGGNPYPPESSSTYAGFSSYGYVTYNGAELMHIHGVEFVSTSASSTDLKLRMDGGAASTTSTTGKTPRATYLTNSSAVTIMGLYGQSFSGQIMEVVAGTGTLTTAERQKMEGYLAHKWTGDDTDLLALLPSDHPYKTSAPTL